MAQNKRSISPQIKSMVQFRDTVISWAVTNCLKDLVIDYVSTSSISENSELQLFDPNRTSEAQIGISSTRDAKLPGGEYRWFPNKKNLGSKPYMRKNALSMSRMDNIIIYFNWFEEVSCPV
ncbi:hypothetical protein CEXT_791581 [Caerostris extrusa]|uniref:Uncharacterized protein n=1 Tax=Caerostris extrusa TaxID=172846 RepID=A0AAV4VQN8_CAEEX|nr:hypothetical protein CEXT_791581 [Caerostris extrusa]